MTLYGPNGQPLPASDVTTVTVRSGPNLDPDFFRSSYSTRSESQAIQKPYALHSWVHACVSRIVTPLANLPKILVDARDPDNEEPVRDHPLLDRLREPNPYMLGSNLWECIYLALMLPTERTPGGQVFLYLESDTGEKYDTRRATRPPMRIWPYTDRVIKPRYRYDASGLKLHDGWVYELYGRTVMEFELNDPALIRIRLYNPYDTTKGLSPYSAGSLAVLQDVKADEFNTAYMDNNGALGGLLTTDSDTITPPELKLYKEQFEEEYTGTRSAGRVAALAHGLKYDRFVQSNADMQYIEQREDNRKRIQAVYGVNDAEIGIFDSGMNRATAEVANRSVWQKMRIPLDRAVMDTLNIVWFRWAELGRYRLKSDYSRVEALLPDYSDRVKAASQLVKLMNVPPAEAARVVGIPLNSERYPWLEKSFVPANLVDAELLAELGMVVSGASGPSEEPAAKHLRTLLARAIQRNGRTLNITSREADLLRIEEAHSKREERERIWQGYVRAVLDPGEKSFRPKMEKHYIALRNEMLDNVDAWLAQQEGTRAIRALVVDPNVFLFDLGGAQEDMLAWYKPEAAKQLRRERAKLKHDWGNAIQWAVNPDTVQSSIKARLRQINSINTTRFNRARKTIGALVKQGIEENATANELATAIKEGISEMTATNMGQALTVARTEMGSVASWGRHEAFKASDIRQHEWLSSKDELVRNPDNPRYHTIYNHAIDGEVRNVGALFSNDLRYPLDSGGAPGNVCNCRCISLPVISKK